MKSAGRATTALPVRYGAHRLAFVKPLPRTSDLAPTTDRFTAAHEYSVTRLGSIVDANCAKVVLCDDPESLGCMAEYAACVSISAFDESILMDEVAASDLRSAGKKVRQTLRERIASDYVFSCWTGDADRNPGGYAFEVVDGRLTGNMSRFDAVQAYQETHPHVDIGEWPDFFADAALGKESDVVAARATMARKIAVIPRGAIEAIFADIPEHVLKPSQATARVNYLVRRQRLMQKTFTAPV